MNALLTTREVASLLRVSEATIRRWKRDGVVPYVRVARGDVKNTAIRYRREDLERFVRAHVLVEGPTGPVPLDDRDGDPLPS